MCKKSTCSTCRKSTGLLLLTTHATHFCHDRTRSDAAAPADRAHRSRRHADHIGCVEKATWWGCGNHVPSVLDQIPEGDRCACEPKVEKEGKMYPPKGPQPEA